MESSVEEHIGEDSEITESFVSKTFQMLCMHPFKNSVTKTEEEATALYRKIMESTLELFSEKCLLGKFEDVATYFAALDLVSVDQAAKNDLTEADFRALLLEHSSDEQSEQIKDIFKKIMEDLNKQIKFVLDRDAEEEEEAKGEEEVKGEEEAKPEVKTETKTEEETKEAVPQELEKRESRFEMRRTITKEMIQSVLTAGKEAAKTGGKKLKLKILDFIRSEQMSSDEAPVAYSVMIEVKDDQQSFQTGQKIASDDDPARTLFNESKEFNDFEIDEEDAAIFVALQDEESDSIGQPIEVSVQDLCKGEPSKIVIKDNAKQKLGELAISGEWIKIEEEKE